MTVIVRPAVTTVAQAATEVLRRSIAQLCVADHHNDPVRLNSWLENKTVANVSAWIASAQNYCVAAMAGDTLCGFAAMTIAGEVMLCYVDPAARFRGVSDAMLGSLEHKAQSLGLSALRLDGTVTARRFYEARGYVAEGRATEKLSSISCQSMVKQIAL
jgi:GNAT superfamily N-acetyltransferase